MGQGTVIWNVLAMLVLSTSTEYWQRTEGTSTFSGDPFQFTVENQLALQRQKESLSLVFLPDVTICSGRPHHIQSVERLPMRLHLKLDATIPHTNSRSAPSSKEVEWWSGFSPHEWLLFLKKKSEACIAKHVSYPGSAFSACYNSFRIKHFIINLQREMWRNYNGRPHDVV